MFCIEKHSFPPRHFYTQLFDLLNNCLICLHLALIGGDKAINHGAQDASDNRSHPEQPEL